MIIISAKHKTSVLSQKEFKKWLAKQDDFVVRLDLMKKKDRKIIEKWFENMQFRQDLYEKASRENVLRFCKEMKKKLKKK